MKLLSSLVICFPLYALAADRRSGGSSSKSSYRQYRPKNQYCDEKNTCGDDKPVCNFDNGDHGFCEECPGHCVGTGYNNVVRALPICCSVCRYGEKNGCDEKSMQHAMENAEKMLEFRRAQTVWSQTKVRRPSMFENFRRSFSRSLYEMSRNIEWSARKAVQVYEATELANEVNEAVAGIVDPKVKKLQDAQRDILEIKNSDKSPEEKVNEIQEVLQNAGINVPFDLEQVKKDVGTQIARKTGFNERKRGQAEQFFKSTGKDVRNNILAKSVSEGEHLLRKTGVVDEESARKVMGSLQKVGEGYMDKMVGPVQEQKISDVVSGAAQSLFQTIKRRVGYSTTFQPKMTTERFPNSHAGPQVAFAPEH